MTEKLIFSFLLKKILKNKIYCFLFLFPLFVACTYKQDNFENNSLNSPEILHNGIVLNDNWPPRYPEATIPTAMVVPYLNSPPKVIPINVGRQLFVDDFLIESNSLQRIFHKPLPAKENPVLEPNKPWEHHSSGAPYAAPFSDGVWYDGKLNKFRMWYLTGGGKDSPESRAFVTAYAESDDGIKWVKPSLNVVSGTNIVSLSPRDSSTIWLDRNEKDASKRYKFFNVEFRRQNEHTVQWSMVLRYSKDGLSWSAPAARSGQIGDRSTVYYDAFREKWIFSLRGFSQGQRRRQYLENKDPELGVSLSHRLYDNAYDKFVYHWFNAWPHDTPHPEFPDLTPAIYNHNAVSYESIMLGYFDIWNGPPNNVARDLEIQKRNRTMIGFSRDGFHWSRSEALPFIGDNPVDGAWNWGNVQSVAGGPLIVGDKLYFYSRGARKNSGFWDGYTSTGLYTMRRDGFASLSSQEDLGAIVTRPLTFDGSFFFVNADVQGELIIEILDEYGNLIPGFRSKPISKNKTKLLVEWESDKKISMLKNKKVRFKFSLIDGDIYSFWVSPWLSGESRGSLPGGGPKINPSGWDTPIKND